MINQEKGISLRTIHSWLVIVAVIMAGIMLYSTFHLSTNFEHVTEASELQIELRKAARELMDASDFLTEQVQRFSVMGEQRYLEAYFEEADQAHHREEAVAIMARGTGDSPALAELKNALTASMELMEREYYAMRLVIEAQGLTDYPKVLQYVTLSEEAQSLAPEDKMLLAAQMVHNDEYYVQKNQIRQSMSLSLDKLEMMAHETDAAALSTIHDEMIVVRVIILLQTFGTISLVWLTSRLAIHPVLNAVARIEEDSPIPELGANEFRYLARTYNKMYEVYKRSLAHLNFKASHDELTGAYNRAGYDLLLSSLDLDSTFMLLFDVDNFKTINDQYGHETGDKILIKFVQVLKQHFRADDYICRLGGDEFVVFMVHVYESQHHLIAKKIKEINMKMAETDDGLPPSSVSVGIAHGSKATGAENLFEITDEAMYQSKRRGKNAYTFYHKGN